MLESMEKRSENSDQMMVESSDCTAGKQSTLPVAPKPVLLTPCRPTSAAHFAPHATMMISSDAAAHSDGNHKTQFSVCFPLLRPAVLAVCHKCDVR